MTIKQNKVKPKRSPKTKCSLEDEQSYIDCWVCGKDTRDSNFFDKDYNPLCQSCYSNITENYFNEV